MKRALNVMLCLCLLVPAYAQVTNKSDKKQDKTPKAAKSGDAKAIEILKKADAATKKVKSVSYNVTVKGSGALERLAPKLTGKVILAGASEQAFDKFYAEFEGSAPGGESVAGTMGSDADEFFLLDPKKKTAYVDLDSAVLGNAGDWLGLLGMREFVHPSPFSDEINGDKQELTGAKKIGDQECFEIHVIYSDQQGEATWYFSKKDFLPRRVDRVQRGPSGEKGTSIVILTELKADPKIDPSIFKVKVPKGWKKTDEPAP